MTYYRTPWFWTSDNTISLDNVTFKFTPKTEFIWKAVFDVSKVVKFSGRIALIMSARNYNHYVLTRALDPDPHGSGSRRVNLSNKNRKNARKLLITASLLSSFTVKAAGDQIFSTGRPVHTPNDKRVPVHTPSDKRVPVSALLNNFQSCGCTAGTFFWIRPLKKTSWIRFLLQGSQPVLWIRIRIGSIFRSFLDPDPYSEYGFGFTRANIG